MKTNNWKQNILWNSNIFYYTYQMRVQKDTLDPERRKKERKRRKRKGKLKGKWKRKGKGKGEKNAPNKQEQLFDMREMHM